MTATELLARHVRLSINQGETPGSHAKDAGIVACGCPGCETYRAAIGLQRVRVLAGLGLGRPDTGVLS